MHINNNLYDYNYYYKLQMHDNLYIIFLVSLILFLIVVILIFGIFLSSSRRCSRLPGGRGGGGAGLGLIGDAG